MTIIELLSSPNFPNKAILEKLVRHSTQLSKEQLFTASDQELNDEQLQRITQGYHAYVDEKQPLEYILGYVEFAGLKFQVTPATLIPRPETEYMIEAVREHIISPSYTNEKNPSSPPLSGEVPNVMRGRGQKFNYNSKLKEKAKDLRKNMTNAEKELWYKFLRANETKRYRQRPIDNYIVDFYCPSAQLVIEIDGDTHYTDQAKIHDEKRTKQLESYGLRIIRFTNTQVYENLDDVCTQIQKHLDNKTKKFHLLDIGTGCGVLGLSVLKHHPDSFDQVILSEYSPAALEIAKQNHHQLFSQFSNLKSQISFVQADLLDHPKINEILKSETPTILVANLPYIPEKLFDDNTDETVKKWEPKMAFVGGEDGLDLYRIMLDQLLAIKKENSPLTPLDEGGNPTMSDGGSLSQKQNN